MSPCSTLTEHLRQKGYRITLQREMIIQTIAHSEQHISAEEVFAEVRKHTPAANLATVYRTLDMLWEEGLACRNDLGECRIVYAALQHGPHIHLVCRYCNRLIDADPQALESLREELDTEYGFTADLQHISIFGVCAGCQLSSEKLKEE
ncbi:MAG: transcriptional repressor [Chloroflexi bacterium]|nr:transcriptional repressor [Chloroflexota bacterium]